MKRLPMFFLILLGLLSCNSNKNSKERTVLIDSIGTVGEMQESPFTDTRNMINSNYEVSLYIFEGLSKDLKNKFVHEHRTTLDDILLRYYDQYATICDLDTVAEVLNSCDFSIKTNRELLSFYIHVLFESLRNAHLDGYVGELMIDACYALFINHPGAFYQHLGLLEKSLQQSFVDSIVRGFYYDDIKEDELDTILKRQEMMLPKMKKQVLVLSEKIKSKYHDIDF